jgi:demethylmenaquinone methyltransferase/2-methoxy-6-polyprenyl-1,4-benzoquinol methylase
MIDLYEWAHRRWPQFVDCSPIDVLGVLEAAHFRARIVRATDIWGLPVAIAVGTKSAGSEQAGLTR